MVLQPVGYFNGYEQAEDARTGRLAHARSVINQPKEPRKVPVNQQYLAALAAEWPDEFNAFYQRAIYKNNGGTPDEDDLSMIVSAMCGNHMHDLDKLHRRQRGESADFSALPPVFRAELESAGVSEAMAADLAARIYPNMERAEAVALWQQKAAKVKGPLAYGVETTNPIAQFDAAVGRSPRTTSTYDDAAQLPRESDG